MSTTRFDPPYPKLEDPDGDGYVVPGENDVSRDQKRTLGSYLASITRGRVPRDEVIEFAGSIPERSNTFPIAEDEIRTKGFTDMIGDRIADTFEYSNSGKFDGRPGGDLNDLVDKGTLGEGNNPTTRPSTLGHYMLNRPATARAGAEVVDSSNAASPARPNFPDQDTTTASSRATVSDTLSEEGLSSSYDPRAARISIDDIRNSTLDMLLAATGKNKGHGDPAEYENNPLKAGIEPSTVQSGISRVDVDDLRPAKYVPLQGMNSTTRRMSGDTGSTDAVITTDGIGEDRYARKSSGVAYSPLEPFTAPQSNISTFAITSIAIYASITAVAAVIVGAQNLFGTDGAPPSVIGAHDSTLGSENDSLVLGKYGVKPAVDDGTFDRLMSFASNLIKSAGAPEFYRPVSRRGYFECAMLGFSAFMGVNPDSSPDQNKAFSFLEISLGLAARTLELAALKQERGYYETIFRNISKNINSIAAEVRSTPDVISFATSGVVESIFSAGIVDIVEVFAKSGDMIYLRYDASREYSINETADHKSNVSFASSRIRSPKASAGSKITSLDGYNIPALRLLPTQYKIKINEALETSNLKTQLFFGDSPKGKNRFTPEQVGEIEQLLDSEYMPFYFQDLRTNEIISFNAFLDDVSDGFQAEYSSISGYGRIEDAKIYKGTKRSLSVKFHLFAANPQDFEHMWWQINKLTTMVYPQWSKGRELSINQGTNNAGGTQVKFPFIQPFSQIPTATPVIRVRVGDLIRSNYSRFNLKRLFGFADPDVSSKQNENSNLKFTSVNEEVTATRMVPERDASGNVVQIKESYTSSKDGPTVTTTELKFSNVRIIGGGTEPVTIPSGTKLSAGAKQDGKSVYEFSVGGKKYRHFASEFNGAVRSTKVETPETRMIDKMISESYVVTSGSTTSGPAMDKKTFYDPDGNAIIRSFESTMGKGLPAVCTSLKFGWMDAPWGAGDDGPGNRAPRYCTVDMQFDVMHDIAPGLDHEGFNRAPLYPVGETITKITEGGETSPYGRGTRTNQVAYNEYNKAPKTRT